MVCERIHHVDVLDASHRGPPRVQRRVAVHVRLRRTKMCQHVVADVDGLHPKKRAEEMEPRAAFAHRRHAKAGLTAVHIHCWPDETRMRWILAKHPTLPPPEPFGDMHTEIEYYANNSPPEHLSPAKNSGSSIELNFRDDNWNNDEWIRAQPASKSAELLFRLEHFLVFE